MTGGPVFAREILGLVRARRSLDRRIWMPILSLVVVGGDAVAENFLLDARPSLAQAALIGRATFGALVVLQLFLVMFGVAEDLGRSLARERDRDTLDALLATPLPSAQIVLGKLGARLLHFAIMLASGLPVMALLPLLGGTDPRLVVMAYVGLASTAFLVAALSLFVSAGARTSREGVSSSVALAAAWLIGPFVALMFLPRYWPSFYAWYAPVNAWLLSSSPLGLVAYAIGAVGSGTLAEQFGWMVALELLGGVGFTLAAIATLRPSARRLADRAPESLFVRLGRWRFRLWSRPPCSDDPVLWKEVHTWNVSGLAKLFGVAIALGLVWLIGLGTYYIARPAFEEVAHYGYRALPGTGLQSARGDFNLALRCGTVIFFLVYGILLAGLPGERLVLERTRKTWDSLLTTPLSGSEILRAYRRGVMYRQGGLAAVAIVLWTVGLAAGSLHPVGYAAVLVCLVVTTRFAAVLSTSMTLPGQSPTRAATYSPGVMILLMLLGMLCFTPTPVASFVWSFTSPPVLASSVLFSYSDMERAWSPSHRVLVSLFPTLPSAPVLVVAGTFAAAMIGFTVATEVLSRFTDRRFDAIVGRPHRAERPARASGTRPSPRGEPQERLANAPPLTGPAAVA